MKKETYVVVVLPSKRAFAAHSAFLYKGMVITACGRYGRKKDSEIRKKQTVECETCRAHIKKHGKRWADC